MMDKMKHINKLPAITLSFWIMKICATTLEEWTTLFKKYDVILFRMGY